MMKAKMTLICCALVLRLSLSEGRALDADGWDTGPLDTARNVSYLSPLEKDVILELNKLRSNPRKYAELYVRPRLRYFNGLLYSEPGKTALRTNEGRAAVEECDRALSGMESLPLLYPREGLSRAARDHALDQGRTGNTGHTSSDGTSFAQRIRRYGQSDGGLAENISYGQDTARGIVLQLLIDDGVSSRGHRNNNMNRAYTVVGVSAGSHQRYRSLCVLDFAAGYVTANNPEEEGEAARAGERRRLEWERQVSARSDPDAANWTIAPLDAGRDADYLLGIEKDIVLELNKLRSNPRKYAELYVNPANSREVYGALAAAESLPLFSLERGLCLAVKDTEGSLSERAGRYGTWYGSIYETSLSGDYTTGRAFVLAMLRSTRDNVLNPRYRAFGLAVTVDNAFGARIKIEFASSYTSQ